MIRDVIVEEARRVRAKLIERHGGLMGLIDHLQELDRQRLEKERKKKAAARKKKAATAGKPQNRVLKPRGPAANGKKPAKNARSGHSRTARK